MIKSRVEILKNEKIAEDIFSMVILSPEMADKAHSGQFASLYTNDASKLLPRPISICEVDKDAGTVRFVYRIQGEGTRQFSELSEGDMIDVVGPIGNGYDLDTKKAVLMGGGIGIPPMLQLARELSANGLAKDNIQIILGYRDETFLLEELENYGTVYISSDSGAVGLKGNVIDAAVKYDITGDMIYACGPKPMLKAVKAYGEEKGIRAQISLEERMACGIGACLACVCTTKEVDDHSQVKNRRICVDGPVFYAEEVEL